MFSFVKLTKLLVVVMKRKKTYICLQWAAILNVFFHLVLELLNFMLGLFEAHVNDYVSILVVIINCSIILANTVGMMSIAKSRQLTGCLLQPSLGVDSGKPNLIRLIFIVCIIQNVLIFSVEFVVGFLKTDVFFRWFVLFGAFGHAICHLLLLVVLVLANVISHNLHEQNKSLERPKECYVSCIQAPPAPPPPPPGGALPDIRYEIAGLRRLEFLEGMTEKFQKIYDQLDEFNERFQMFFVAMVAYVTIINLLDWSCLFLLYLHLIVEANESLPEELWFIILHIMYILVTWSHLMLAVLTSEQLQNEGENTSRICYSLLNELPAGPSFAYYQLIREQINLLLNQNNSRKVYLHTGGFFRVNWSVFGAIASIVATYAIIIIQLDPNYYKTDQGR